EAEHAPIEALVPRVDLDQQIRAAMDAPRIDERDVEERGEQRLRMHVVVDRELRELRELATVATQRIRLGGVEAVDEEAIGRIEPDGDGACGSALVVRRDRDTARRITRMIADRITAPRVAALDQIARGALALFGIREANLEQVRLRLDRE